MTMSTAILPPPTPIGTSDPIPEGTTLYKALTTMGQSPLRGTRWSLPYTPGGDEIWEPGAWTAPVSDPCPCVRGWHLTSAAGLVRWGQRCLYTAELGGPYATRDHGIIWKVAGSQARLLAPVAAWNPTTWTTLATVILDSIKACADSPAQDNLYWWFGLDTIAQLVVWVDTHAGHADFDWHAERWYTSTSTDLDHMVYAWHAFRCTQALDPDNALALADVAWEWYNTLLIWLRESCSLLGVSESHESVWGAWLGALHDAALAGAPLPSAPPAYSWGDPAYFSEVA